VRALTVKQPFADARPLTTPILDVPGQLGLWTPDDDALAAVHAQLAGAAA
jgi:hypothetical protein